MKKLAIILALLFVVGGCKKKKPDMAKYKDRLAALTAKYSPKLADLSKELPGLADRAKDLPVDVPGADKLQKLLAENKSTLASAQDLLKSLPDKIGHDSPEQAEKDLAAAEKELAADVAIAEKDEKEEDAVLDAIENAKTAGSGSSTGSNGSAGK